MKTPLLIAVLGLLVPMAHAQWTVYDPAVHVQLITGTAQEIAKYVEMINNQVQQITRLKEQLDSFNQYKDRFGDPASAALDTVVHASEELLRAEAGQNLNTLVSAADGTAAVTYDGRGLFVAVGATFKTPAGTTVSRNDGLFRPFDAIHRATANYVQVSGQAEERRRVLKEEIAANIRALQQAKTDAEVQKLSAGLTALNGALDSVDHEVQEALATALTQDIENRNHERLQEQARLEEHMAEFHEATENYRKTFKLMSAPVEFRTP